MLFTFSLEAGWLVSSGICLSLPILVPPSPFVRVTNLCDHSWLFYAGVGAPNPQVLMVA